MDAGMATIDVSANGSALRAEHMAYIEDRLGPKPGKWDGYDDIADDDIRRDVWGKVGYIHGMSAEAGRSIVAVGQTLCQLKSLLPHGQFMACVKAEFGWNRQWAAKLMSVADYFANVSSRIHLPCSAQVLAQLATAGADDATVEQAAEERWTVAETKQRLRKPGQPRQPQPAEAMALSILRKGELDRLRAALELAERASAVTAAEVMEEQRLRDLGKLRFIPGMEADFHRMKDGDWIRLPHAGDVDVTTEPTPEPVQPLRQQLELQHVEPARGEVVAVDEAAKRIGVNHRHLCNLLGPSKNPDGITRGGYRVTREGRGMVRLVPVE